ncbi:MAG: type II toxin-antitoxin system PemK/MazF family toxin [Alcaligenaceae bacterium]|nr:MAG: type II toxin-antitoxin system PemK/MazF family toxin [Alcaligenaceae bacterium]
MSINFHPDPGTILICDFRGLEEPEMIKRRPVVVVSPKFKDRTGLCTVVPLSTTPPRPVKPYHFRLQVVPVLPAPYDSEWHWVKADMVYALSFKRFYLPTDGKMNDGKRIYELRVVSAVDLQAIRQCLLKGLGLGN